LSIVQGPLSVAPCQTLIPRFAAFSSLYPRLRCIMCAGGCSAAPYTHPRASACFWLAASTCPPTPTAMTAMSKGRIVT
jgi:hypothetical protein